MKRTHSVSVAQFRGRPVGRACRGGTFSGHGYKLTPPVPQLAKGFLGAASMIVSFALTCGCSEVRIVRTSDHPKQEGLRFYRPHPYLLVTKTTDGEKQTQLIWLPNMAEEYVVDVVGAFGTVDASITLQDGWNLTALGDARDTKIPETIGAITGSIRDLSAPRASLDLGAGLWRLNFSDQGFVSGATEVPLSSPPKAAASSPRTLSGTVDALQAQSDVAALQRRVVSLCRERLDLDAGVGSFDYVDLPVGALYHDTEFLNNAIALLSNFQNRIVGGVETTEFPDCVAVGERDQWCCTGTLVAPNVVVTAGHCWEGACDVRVFFGTDVDHPEKGRIVAVKQAVPHPDYSSPAFLNDLTVLILAEDVDVPPRAIAQSSDIDDSIAARLVGFGTTDSSGTIGYGKRRSVDVPIVSAACARLPGEDEPYGCHKDLEIVAGRPFLNRDSCAGDSGGPALVQVNGQWYLAGATSRATANSTRPCGDGGIYVRLDRYADWVRSVPGGHWPDSQASDDRRTSK